MTKQPKTRLGHWVLVGLIVVAVAVFVVFRGRPIGIENGNGRPKPDESAQAVELKNDAIALMENWRFDLAAEKLSELEKLAPNEPLVRRNRAIAAVLAIAPEVLDKTRKPEAFQLGFVRANEAVEKLLAAEPELPIAHLLAARLAEHRDERTKVVEHLEMAARLSNGAAAFEVEVYLASQVGQQPELEARGYEALKRAAAATRDNLWVLKELAIVQAVTKDVGVRETFAQLRECSQPFAELLKQLRRVDLLELIDKGAAAAEQQDWNTATRNARIVSNLLKPEIATKLDLRKVTKHPLEYVVSEFSAEWQQQHGEAIKQSEMTAAAPIEVKFVEADAADQLPPLAGIRDVKIADFDLDGRWDVIVLLNGQVIVFGQAAGTVGTESQPTSRWVTLCEAVVPSGLTKFLAADLDRDTEETPEKHRFIGQPDEHGKLPEGAAASAEDADIDLLVYGDEGILFLRNEFDAATKTRSLKALSQDAPFEGLRGVLAIAPADVDHDGDLDLIASSGSGLSIWQNNDSREHTKFADISVRSALPSAGLKATVLLPVDWNFDLQTDVLVTGPDVAQPGYLENISHGRLRWREWTESDLPIAKMQSLHLVAVQKQPLRWDVRGSEQRAQRLWDFDNNGEREVLSWGESSLMSTKLMARVSGTALAAGDFDSVTPVASAIPLTTSGSITNCEIADFDGDGDEDVLVVSDQRAMWVRNDGGNKNGWLELSIRADKDRLTQRDVERTNIHGVGSWVELRGSGLPESAGRKQHVRIVEGQSTHFGLGALKQVGACRIVWTSGVPQNVLRPRSGEAIAAQQYLIGSCPYIYTWDGEKWAFFTDCLWAAPIGLQLAEGVLAPSREWEFLKIDGDRLPESNGEYRLMLTEELWEAAYFDQVRLLAVDHPVDVEFFTNEKVGPPSISEFKLHPVRKRHVPVAAHDHRGRDVLPRVAKRDEQYLRAFDKVIQQGLTEEHFIELDLGDLHSAKNVTLFLTGWIFPTDTSINVSLSQNPDRDAPKPPAIWVADEERERGRGGEGEKGIKWREAIPYIGFPGGKTKTIAVDVTEALGINQDSALHTPHSAFKLRIVTSMELYWDEMFFTVDEPPLEQTTTELPLLAADLQFRGFSARHPSREFGPERYDAADVTQQPQWPPMGGRFTRFGDVTELLTASDDRLAVLGSGDALAVRFDATQGPPLPAGWKRDFVIHNVGWDKDANLNTIYGQFVEPLPFRGMQGYPDVNGAESIDTPTHRDYLRRFQTREQNREAFWRGH